MKHKFRTIVLICSILFVAIACNIDNGGHTINFSGDETPAGIQEFVPGAPPMIPDSEIENYSASQEPKATPQPEDKPEIPQNSDNVNPVSVNEGSHEYSVEATSFNCTCQTGGNVNPNFDFQGDHLIAWGDQVYNKIGENTYKREYMGYYILSFPDEPGRENEKVDELHTSIITINSNGYVEDSYKGTEMDHCCLYTMTSLK